MFGRTNPYLQCATILSLSGKQAILGVYRLEIIVPRLVCFVALQLAITSTGNSQSNQPISPSTSSDYVLKQLNGVSSTVDARLNGRTTGIDVQLNGTSANEVKAILPIMASTLLPITLCTDREVKLSDDDCREIAAIASLQGLDLTETQLSNEGISQLIRSNSLRTLALPANRNLASVRGDSFWSPSLQFLDLNGCSLTIEHWKMLSKCQSLTFLDTAQSDRQLILPNTAWQSLGKLNSLRFLRINIGIGEKKQLGQLHSLHQLETLVLVGDQHHAAELSRQDAETLTTLARCHTLSFHGISVDAGAFEALARMPGLKRLMVENCHIEPNQLMSFDELHQLKVLGLPFSEITNVGMDSVGKLKGLTSLNIAACKVDDEGIKELSQLNNLETICVAHTRISDSGINVLAHLPNLKCIDAQSTQISDLTLKTIAAEGRVEALGLRGTQVSRDGITHLSRLSALRILDLSEINIDRDTAESLQCLNSLEELYVVNCGLTDECLEQILKLPHLRKLDLSRNAKLTPDGLRLLANHPTLSQVSVDGCGVSRTTMLDLTAHVQIFHSRVMTAKRRVPKDFQLR